MGHSAFENSEMSRPRTSPGAAPRFKSGQSTLQIGRSPQTLKDEPQPQVDLTFGFWNLNPAPCRPST
jgi:hypothetical protein